MAHLTKELGLLTSKLLTMASYAESSVRQAVHALETRDYDLALRVRDDDALIDALEVEVDETVIRLLAKAPLAKDLRLIAVSMKISNNLERVGDEAAKLANRVRDLSQEPPLHFKVGIPRLADSALFLLKNALDCFVARDPVAARALIPQDKQMDALNREIHRELADHMIEDPEVIPRCLNLMVVAKRLERIGDHAKNIAEEVVFLCDAEDIRHPRLLRQA
jgi:phosphate transport system protein